MSLDLIERLRAAIDEDERTAMVALSGPWRAGGEWRIGTPADDNTAVYAERQGGGWDNLAADTRYAIHAESNASHIARHDPKRILARVAADREILALHQRTDDYPHECTTCGDFGDCGCARGNEGWPCPTLLALAKGYGIDSSAG